MVAQERLELFRRVSGLGESEVEGQTRDHRIQQLFTPSLVLIRLTPPWEYPRFHWHQGAGEMRDSERLSGASARIMVPQVIIETGSPDFQLHKTFELARRGKLTYCWPDSTCLYHGELGAVRSSCRWVSAPDH